MQPVQHQQEKKHIPKTEILSCPKGYKYICFDNCISNKEMLYRSSSEDSANYFLFGKDTAIQTKHQCFQQLWLEL